MGTYQNDPLEGALFVLAHFRALRFIANCFPFCLFPSIANDIHIIGPILIILNLGKMDVRVILGI
jgi:hypothetical protein